MGGQSTYQRSTLTANHGTYYLDTSVSLNTQNTENFTTETPISVNVFKGGQTYYMFFLYTKPETQQTYQIYVGPGFTPPRTCKDMRSLLNTLPMVASDITLSPSLPHRLDVALQRLDRLRRIQQQRLRHPAGHHQFQRSDRCP